MPQIHSALSWQVQPTLVDKYRLSVGNALRASNEQLRLDESDAVSNTSIPRFVRGAAFEYSGHSPVRAGFLEAIYLRADEHRAPRKLLIPLASL